MKFIAGIVAALAGRALAASAMGQAFTFPRQEPAASTTSLGRSLARLVVLQRLGKPGEGPTIRDIPKGMSVDEAVAILNKFAASDDALFLSEPASAPRRLLVMMDGMTEQEIEEAGNSLGQDAAFTIEDVPSCSANRDLFDIDLYNMGTKTGHNCSLGEIVQMQNTKCWGKSSTAARYSAVENTNTMADVLKALAFIPELAKAGTVEATVIFLPKTSNDAKSSWADAPNGLRRRQAEQVISSNHKAASMDNTHAAASSETPFVAKKPIPSCFNSEEACMAATGNCSSHGECRNKYGKVPEKPKEGEVCFTCHCRGTHNPKSGPTLWGGPSCAKQDVSVPFWLFFGFSVVLVGVVWMAISLLFGIGEEKLPGVIGAGVSRSK